MPANCLASFLFKMISHKFQYIFIHIPKCGGTSIEKSLLESEGVAFPTESDTMPLKHLTKDVGDKYLLGKGRQHMTISDYPKINYFKFAFIRNPWDKMVSEWEWRRTLTNTRVGSFDDFILNPPYDIFPEHLRPQVQYIDNSLSYLGRFENIQADFDCVSEKLGLDRIELTRQNKTDRGPYWEYYNDETRSIIAVRYAQDIELFKYRF